MNNLTNPNLPITRLEREIVTDPTTTLEREWLVTNGIGGFAGASLCGANTRRYHGLLVAALQPPLARTVLLGKFDEQVEIAGQTYNLDVNEWRDGSAGLNGLEFLDSFELEGNLPKFTYRLGSARLTKTIWCEYGQNTVYVRYTHLAQDQPLFELRVRPLANCRDYHANTVGQLDRPFAIERQAESNWLITAWPDAPQWRLLTFDRPVQWRPDAGSGWYWGFHYRHEQERGLGADDDMYCLGTWVTTLAPGQSVTFVATTEPTQVIETRYQEAYQREVTRLRNLLTQSEIDCVTYPQNDLQSLAIRLTLAADQFVVGRPDPSEPGKLLLDYRTVIAGYPWFSDWGRDTMISLPGLTIVTRRYAEAALILRSFARFVSQGMLPNRFPDSAQPLGESDYNTVDATLWYFDAVAKYLVATKDHPLGQELYPVLADIVRWHLAGTRFGIKVDPADGLLMSGVPGVQLTWMDVKIDEWVVTPRRGKPIEINALWYRACRIMTDLASQYGTPAEVTDYTAQAERVAAAFERTYWYESGGYFYDNLDDTGQPDPSLRPNQAIALAVAPELVSPAHAQAALTRVRESLLTPYGLRSLSPTHPDYHPTYTGDRIARDSAYHQGTIWPWLLGPFARAQAHFFPSNAIKDLQNLLNPFLIHLDEAAVGQVSEVFGAEPPFPPGGCFAQAWNVSELLEIWQLLWKLQ